jgi:hypothetical protein
MPRRRIVEHIAPACDASATAVEASPSLLKLASPAAASAMSPVGRTPRFRETDSFADRVCTSINAANPGVHTEQERSRRSPRPRPIENRKC